ncbi:hypothetical protein OROMI_008134 [Orobanche minor]
MRRLKSGNLFVAAEIYRKRLLRSVPICDSSHRSLSTGGGFGMSRKPYHRKRLPAELSALGNVVELSCHSAARQRLPSLFGRNRARFSKSNEEVKALINFVKPQVNARKGEFYVANEEGIKYGAKVVLGDPNLDITMARLPIMAFLWEHLVSSIQIIMKKNVLGPGASNLAHDEIDWSLDMLVPSRYKPLSLSAIKIYVSKVARCRTAAYSVVAVVGKDHLRGIRKHWKEPVDNVKFTMNQAPTKETARTDNFASITKISDGHNNYERKMLPPEISRSVVKLECESSADGGVCHVYLVGDKTWESWQQVEGVIRFLKPQVVFLEMCSNREHHLTGQKVELYMSAKLLEVAREHNTVVAVVETVHLPGIQKHWKEPVDVKILYEATSQRTNGKECNHDGHNHDSDLHDF